MNGIIILLGLIGMSLLFTLVMMGGFYFGFWVVNTLTDGELKKILN